MSRDEPDFCVTLVKNSISFPVEIEETSRYSIFIKFSDKSAPLEPREQHLDFDSAIFRSGDECFELKSCRFLPEPAGTGREGWLLFLSELPDMIQLLSKKRLVLSDISFWNLSLILAQKDRIRQKFKEFSSNITFELSVCKQFFDDMERKFIHEPSAVREELTMQVIEREGRDFLEFFHQKAEELRDHTAGSTREQEQDQGFFFRKQVWEYILLSKFLTRVNLKPRGYAGDYEMMRMLYANEYEGGSIFAKLLHKYPLETKSAQAVRNRKTMIPQMIHTAYRERKKKGDAGPFRILSVACGPASELEGIFRGAEEFERFEITLLDQDEEALTAAKHSIRSTELKAGKKIAAEYRTESVRILSRATYLARHPAKFDFIYTMGLFDYLIPQVGSIVFSTLYGLLKPGGELVVGNFHVNCPDKTFMEYWCDWVLYYRTKDDMLKFTRQWNPAMKQVLADSTGCQLFLQVVAAPDGASKTGVS